MLKRLPREAFGRSETASQEGCEEGRMELGRMGVKGQSMSVVRRAKDG